MLGLSPFHSRAYARRPLPRLGALVFAVLGAVPLLGLLVFNRIDARGRPTDAGDETALVAWAAGLALLGAAFGYRIGVQAVAGQARRVIALTLLFPPTAIAVLTTAAGLWAAVHATGPRSPDPAEAALTVFLYLTFYALVPAWMAAGLAAKELYVRARRGTAA